MLGRPTEKNIAKLPLKHEAEVEDNFAATVWFLERPAEQISEGGDKQAEEEDFDIEAENRWGWCSKKRRTWDIG